MEIRVNNTLIDIANADDVVLKYSNYRFADAIQDQFSTELEIVRTEETQRVLSAYIQLDNTNQTFGTRILCSASIGAEPEDGYLQVTTLSKDAITATLYLSLLPYACIEKKINEVMRGCDNTSTIKAFDKEAATTKATGHTTNYEYSYYQYSRTMIGSEYAHQHLSGQLYTMQSAIGTKLGITMSMTHPTLANCRIVAPDRYVCPENDVQVVTQVYDTDSPTYYSMLAGQHITNDAVGFDTKDGRVDAITYNRAASCNLEYWIHHIVGGVLKVKKYVGGAWTVVAQTATIYSVGYSHGNINGLSFSAGDIVRVELENPSITSYTDLCSCMVCKIKYTSYSVSDEDYQGDELSYPSKGAVPYIDDFGGSAMFDGSYNHPSLGVLPRLSFSYFGYWVNAGSYSVKDFINWHCWATGTPLVVDGTTINLSKDGPRSIEVDGNITEISPVCDNVGMETSIGYQGDESPQTIYFDSEFLEDSVKLYTAPFQSCKPMMDLGCNGNVLFVQQYTGESSTDEGTSTTVWRFKFEKLNAIAGLATQRKNRNYQNRYFLAPMGLLDWQGIDGLNGRTIVVKFDTLEDLRNYDYFYYEGRKYMIITVDYEAESGISNVTALEVYPKSSTN